MPDWLEIAMRLVAAAVLGGAIGLNRHLHHKATGLRTLSLVACSAASLVLGLAWWFLWIVWFDVSCALFAQADLYARAPAFFWISALIGMAGIAVPWLAYRWFSNHPKFRERAARLLQASTGGSSLGRASALLAQIERFEKC